MPQISADHVLVKKELIQGTTLSSHIRGGPKMTWIDNIKSWSGLSLTELTRKRAIAKALQLNGHSDFAPVIWHIISIFWVFLFENIAFWEVPPGNHKCRLAYLMLTRSVSHVICIQGACRHVLCNAGHVAPHPLSTRNKQQIRIRFRSQSALSLTYVVTLTFNLGP